jgi:CRP/FNR family transcriptional regulator, cyclic AMP receptor protein
VSATRPEKPIFDSPLPVKVEELSALAKKFADQQMYDEAIHLYEMAVKVDPGSLALKINLAKAKEMKKEAEESRFATAAAELSETRRKDDIDANHYIGLAEFYIAKDQTAKGIELLEIAKLKSPNFFVPFKMLARLYASRGDWNAAAEEIVEARKLNPFDKDVAELSGRVEFEKKEYRRALAEFVDAFLLHTDPKSERVASIRRMVHTLRKILGLDNNDLNSLIRERVEALQIASERLELRKENLFKGDARNRIKDIIFKKNREGERRENLLATAGDMRRSQTLSHFKDEQIFKLARAVKIRTLADGEKVFAAGDESLDVYVVLEGGVKVSVDTPFGPQEMSVIQPDEFFGEMNFIDKQRRSTDAWASGTTRLIMFSFIDLETVLEEDKEIAADLYWAFWKSLSAKVRQANETLKTFFAADAARGKGPKREEDKERRSRTVTVDMGKKVDLLRERGLSASELKLLATFSTEEHFSDGSTIFREGEIGDKLFIILDGRVRISKFIPGVGEEALAILERGDFFGEMALIDDKPRSADARAHEGGATVLSIDRATLNEILGMDPAASLQFLNLLSIMISRRLREINEKIINWKYMSGGF